jgi:hypothetical protein
MYKLQVQFYLPKPFSKKKVNFLKSQKKNVVFPLAFPPLSSCGSELPGNELKSTSNDKKE